MIKFACALAVLALAIGPAAAADAVMTADEKAQTDYALSRGQLIYRLDKAAWVGTDAMLAKLKKSELAEVRGWVVEPNGQGETVTFYGVTGDVGHGLFVAEVSNGKVARSTKIAAADRQPLTEQQTRLAKAVKAAGAAAVSNKFQLCAAKPFNTVAIPPAKAGDPIDVYLLTPQTKTNVIPFGGHHKVTVAADGSMKARPFTRSCLDMATKDGKRSVVALTVSHLLDPTPTEVHVFSALAAKLPVGVGTTSNDSVWFIEGGKITKLDAKQPAPAPVAPAAAAQ